MVLVIGMGLMLKIMKAIKTIAHLILSQIVTVFMMIAPLDREQRDGLDVLIKIHCCVDGNYPLTLFVAVALAKFYFRK